MRTIVVASAKTAVQLAAVAIAAVLVGAFNASVAHASSGGGCTTDDSGSVRACLSANGDRLEPDLYVLKAANCESVSITVYDITTSKTVWSDSVVNNGCVAGHHGPWPLDSANTNGLVVNGHVYQTGVVIKTSVNGTTYHVVVSPYLTLAY